MPVADSSTRGWWQRWQHGALNLLLLAAVLAFGVGIWAPMLTLTKLMLIENTYSVMSGIWRLYLEREYLLFIVLGLFTVVLPVVKLTLLFYAWNRPRTAHRRSLRWMDILGKWSMLDVFVVAVLIASVKLGPVATMELHYGLYLFSASVVMIMLASHVVYQRVQRITRDAPG